MLLLIARVRRFGGLLELDSSVWDWLLTASRTRPSWCGFVGGAAGRPRVRDPRGGPPRTSGTRRPAAGALTEPDRRGDLLRRRSAAAAAARLRCWREGVATAVLPASRSHNGDVHGMASHAVAAAGECLLRAIEIGSACNCFLSGFLADANNIWQMVARAFK